MGGKSSQNESSNTRHDTLDFIFIGKKICTDKRQFRNSQYFVPKKIFPHMVYDRDQRDVHFA